MDTTTMTLVYLQHMYNKPFGFDLTDLNFDDVSNKLFCTFSELDEIDNRGYHGDTLIGPISPRNEIAALSFLAGICRTRLERYPTNFEDDLYRLENDETLEPFSNRKFKVVTAKRQWTNRSTLSTLQFCLRPFWMTLQLQIMIR